MLLCTFQNRMSRGNYPCLKRKSLILVVGSWATSLKLFCDSVFPSTKWYITYFTGSLGGLNRLVLVKHLEQCLAHREGGTFHRIRLKPDWGIAVNIEVIYLQTHSKCAHQVKVSVASNRDADKTFQGMNGLWNNWGGLQMSGTEPREKWATEGGATGPARKRRRTILIPI